MQEVSWRVKITEDGIQCCPCGGWKRISRHKAACKENRVNQSHILTLFFCVLAIVNKAAMNMGVHIYFQASVFGFFG